MTEKEKRLTELNQEFLDGKQVLTESLKEAVKEAKRQYDAIDNALEVLLPTLFKISLLLKKKFLGASQHSASSSTMSTVVETTERTRGSEFSKCIFNAHCDPGGL